MKKFKKIISYIGYWLIQCTWGFIMTFIGACAALGLIITGHKPKTLGPNVYFEVGEGWGGVELGPFFLCSKDSSMHTKYHESGHGLQNLIWGPLMPFIICLPSAARYWLYELTTPMKRAIYTAAILVGSLALCTLGAWLMTFTGVKGLAIAFEILRIYFILLVLWLNIFQLPKFQNGTPEYDSVWFEGQATAWGTKVYGKKED